MLRLDWCLRMLMAVPYVVESLGLSEKVRLKWLEFGPMP